MKVILTKDVLSLGETGDVVNVADGYARNFLLPSGVAEKATDGALKKRERNIERIKAKADKVHQQAQEIADKVQELGKIAIKAKAGDTGKLFGAITTRQLAQIIKEKTEIEIDRKNFTLSNPINHIGEYKLTIKLTSKVAVDLPVQVSAEEIRDTMTDEFKSEVEAMEKEKEVQKAQQIENYKKSAQSDQEEE